MGTIFKYNGYNGYSKQVKNKAKYQSTVLCTGFVPHKILTLILTLLLISASSDFCGSRQLGSALGQQWATSQEFVNEISVLS